MTRAVAWDIDGTLVDSEGLHHLALTAVSARYGVPITADDDRFIGVDMDEVWSALRPLFPAGMSRSEWQQEVVAAYLAGACGLRPFPGLLDTMAELQRAGVRQCRASNSARAIVTANLSIIGAAAFLDFAICRDDVVRGKPDPEPYRKACQRLDLPAMDVLAVEDSETGLASARAAGCHVVRFGAGFAGYDRVLELIFANQDRQPS